MNNKKAVRKIGASFILTLALVGFTYVLLPSGDSARAASRVSPAVSTPKASRPSTTRWSRPRWPRPDSIFPRLTRPSSYAKASAWI